MIPLPDDTKAHISHGDVSTAEKSLGVGPQSMGTALNILRRMS
jgi:hypothetical protein